MTAPSAFFSVHTLPHKVRVLRATALGMCFGVRDALALADSIDAPADVTIHGELVHNSQVIEALRARGFSFTPEPVRDALPRTHQALVTAHGISDRERERLLRAGIRLIDTTCPLVVRVHEAAQRLARAGCLVLVIGRPGHVEVRGIVEDLDDYEVIATAGEVRCYESDRLGLVCQSTAALAQVDSIRRAVVACNPHADIEFIDTVCGPTRERQAALESLLPQVDAVVVVGGRNSNNTARLVQRCVEAARPVLHITGPAELDPNWCRRFRTIGLTAGTSTPDAVVDAVHAAILV